MLHPVVEEKLQENKQGWEIPTDSGLDVTKDGKEVYVFYE